MDMIDQVQSLCTQTYHLRILFGNSISLKEKDGKCIEGTKKDSLRRVSSLYRSTRYVLLPCRSCCNNDVPTTFELVSKTHKLGGVGKGLRRILTTQKRVKTAEDYLPLKEQVKSALEMVENLYERLKNRSM